ncbi:MAG TPA: hypothetical protein VLC06_13190 [Polyangia bacterium]|jgi:hypothetical protein|nr:hypothetical protein [Polyangia bacterium]
MVRRPSATALLALLPLFATAAWARDDKDLKPLEPLSSIKPHEGKPGEGDGYFDEVFGMDDAGKQLAVIRSDGATFAKIETYDLEAKPPKLTASFDLPGKNLIVTRIELLPPGKGMVLIGRDRPDDAAPLTAFLVDGGGKVTGKTASVTAFARPPDDGTPRAELLVAFNRKMGGRGAEATYTIVPYHLATLTTSGGPRVYKTDVAGELKTPPVRLIGFYDGYTRILGEKLGAYDKAADVRQPPKKMVVDALSGKTTTEAEISDPVGWAVTGQLRRDHPGQSLFVDLNQDGSGVDVIDAMGKKVPAALAVPFRLYDPKTLLFEEGPAPNHLTFGLAVDPLNPDAIKRKKAEMPMLDLYAADAADGVVKARGRVFTPRPVTYRVRAQTLVVLKRFKSFARGGDEFQVFELH